jgi:hypothetical protein
MTTNSAFWPPVCHCFVLGFIAVAVASTLHAQQTKPNLSAPIDIAVTSQSIRATDASTGSERWLKGGAIEFHARMVHGLGVVASVTGGHCDVDGDNFNLVTTVFGPRYTFDLAHNRIQIFGQALAGMANQFANTAIPFSTHTGSNSLAVQAGGGLDINFSQHFAVRAVQVDYVRTQLPDGHSNVQNMPRIGGGIVFRFGHSQSK